MTAVPTSNAVTHIVEDQPEIIDVWSRASTKYRVRAALMLVLLGILFGCLCCFTFWLRTGSYTPWEHPAFRDLFLRSFTGADGNPITLVDFLTNPIPVQAVPIHAVIMGLQLASLCSIPILISILYRLPSSVPFCAMIVFLAAMPWLGIAIQVGCLLACMGPFRFRFRYASALIALLPIGAYFIGASWRPQDVQFASTRNQALLYAPWVLALLASCVISAFALAVARFINFRPGGIPPLLAVLFAIPVIMFHTSVGRHELEYRILERDIGIAPSSVFAAVDLGKAVEAIVVERWQQSSDVGFEDLRATEMAKAERALRVDFEAERLYAIERCDRFIEQFPDSHYVGNVLLLKGRAVDARLDESLLAAEHIAKVRTLPPVMSSRRVWEAVASYSPQSRLAVPAIYRLAYLDAVAGDVDKALQRLDHVQQAFSPRELIRLGNSNDTGVISSVFERRTPAESLGIATEPFLVEAARLAELVRACAPAPTEATATTMPAGDVSNSTPLQNLLKADPHHPRYTDNLSMIVDRFPDSAAAEFARVLRAQAESAIPSRIRQLEQLNQDLKKKPAGAMAAYFLADVLESERKLAEALAVFEELANRFPESCWASEARARLVSLRTLIDARKL